MSIKTGSLVFHWKLQGLEECCEDRYKAVKSEGKKKEKRKENSEKILPLIQTFFGGISRPNAFETGTLQSATYHIA
jgi:hypothetical protein